ncbi:MAG: ArsR family transcriptional regulator, partial [Thermoplasmata archaeon]|nr:ArsR family transcriptional regulator [Thermoplasmata archaeon]
MGTQAASATAGGLGALRRRGAVTELLFLYDLTTRDVPNLRGIAERLGVTVQAVSHSFRQLRRRGLVEMRRGLYRPT